MITLIVGKPNSGKSRMAEDISLKLAQGRKRYYVATMIPFGVEGQERIEKHRKMREGKGFITLEWPDDIAARITEGEIDFNGSVVLLECISNLTGNEMHSEDGQKMSDEQIVCKILDGIRRLSQKAEELVVVTNKFDLEEADYDDDTKRYIGLTDRVNAELTSMSDKTYAYIDGEWNE